MPVERGVDFHAPATVGHCVEMIQMAMQQKVAPATGAVYSSLATSQAATNETKSTVHAVRQQSALSCADVGRVDSQGRTADTPLRSFPQSRNVRWIFLEERRFFRHSPSSQPPRSPSARESSGPRRSWIASSLETRDKQDAAKAEGDAGASQAHRRRTRSCGEAPKFSPGMP